MKNTFIPPNSTWKQQFGRFSSMLLFRNVYTHMLICVRVCEYLCSMRVYYFYVNYVKSHILFITCLFLLDHVTRTCGTVVGASFSAAA